MQRVDGNWHEDSYSVRRRRLTKQLRLLNICMEDECGFGRVENYRPFRQRSSAFLMLGWHWHHLFISSAGILISGQNFV